MICIFVGNSRQARASAGADEPPFGSALAGAGAGAGVGDGAGVATGAPAPADRTTQTATTIAAVIDLILRPPWESDDDTPEAPGRTARATLRAPSAPTRGAGSSYRRPVRSAC